MNETRLFSFRRDAFGGVPTYIEWAKAKGEDVVNMRDFFTNSRIWFWYLEYMRYMLTRNNTMTGHRYKDDPTIFAYATCRTLCLAFYYL